MIERAVSGIGPPDPIGARLVAEYCARTPASCQLHERLSAVLPAGETRAVTHHLPYPLGVMAASGSRFVDCDGHEYLDLANNMASLVHGHAYPPVMEAVEATLHFLGSAPGPAHETLARFAELLVARYPAFERLRLTNSGSEAAMLALRIARRATGRPQAVLMIGGYHGMAAEFVDDSPAMCRIPYNDVDTAVASIDETKAAVFVEPFLGHAGVVPAEPGFLRAIEDACRSSGSLLILDETQSLRDHFGGHHGHLGLSPDLVIMGKSVGGGFPIGVVGGRESLLQLAAATTDSGLKHSGTFNGNPVSAAAGHAALGALTSEKITALNRNAEWLSDELEKAGRHLGIPLTVTRSGSTMCMHFRTERPTNASEAEPHPHYGRWIHLAALLEGVAVIKGGRLNLSTAVSAHDLSTASGALRRSLSRLVELDRGTGPA